MHWEPEQIADQARIQRHSMLDPGTHSLGLGLGLSGLGRGLEVFENEGLSLIYHNMQYYVVFTLSNI